MSEVNIVAVIYPTSGKGGRLQELVAQMCKDVHEKEDYTLRYIMTEQVDASGEPDIVMIETYKDQAGADKHRATQHFKDLFAKFEKEGLLAKQPYLAVTKNKAGFDLDHKLI